MSGKKGRGESDSEYDPNDPKKSKLSVSGDKQDEQPIETRVFSDPVHGHIELHPLMVKFIDTPQFQRLRYIKQLGGEYYVFPGASHNRFEHSIGVGYLAGELVETLQKKQKELHIDEKDVLCVKLAGLCHDLGHGPFSHMFDGMFIPEIEKAKASDHQGEQADKKKKWKHEDASIMMLKHIIEETEGLEQEMRLKYKFEDEDFTFIEELINRPFSALDRTPDKKVWKCKGRTKEKNFLYEIVANKENGVDVDKMDYFARDCYHLGIANGFDFRRYKALVRIIADKDGYTYICLRDKEIATIYEMFHTRMMLHRKAYKHKTCSIVEHMITDALVAANDHLTFRNKERKDVKMSEAINIPEVYTKLTDHVLQQILLSENENLKRAKIVVEQIERRELYKCVGEWPVSLRKVNELVKDIEGQCSGLADKSEAVIVEVVKFDYGMKEENPIHYIRFYNKATPNKIQKMRYEASSMLPKEFMEKRIRVICRYRDEDHCQKVKSIAEKVCKENQPTPMKEDEPQEDEHRSSTSGHVDEDRSSTRSRSSAVKKLRFEKNN